MAKYNNFRLTEVIPGKTSFAAKLLRAKVDVTTGFLFFKKTVTKDVFRRTSFWQFEDTGSYTELHYVETLSQLYALKQGKPYIEDCVAK